jgi:hypothetical protein
MASRGRPSGGETRSVLAFWSNRRALKALSLLCIASALSVTTAVFTITDGLLYRLPPFHNPDELAVLTYRPVAGQIPPIAYEIALQPERERLRAAIVESGLVQSPTRSTCDRLHRRCGRKIREASSHCFSRPPSSSSLPGCSWRGWPSPIYWSGCVISGSGFHLGPHAANSL